MTDNPPSRSQGLALIPAPETPKATPVRYTPQAPLDSAFRYAEASKSPASKRAYASDFRDFEAWTAERGLAALPASIETACSYLADTADRGLKVSTIRRRAAAITYVHRMADHEPPTNAEATKAVLAGIRRELGVRPERKEPVTAETIKKMLSRAPANLIGSRDRALLLVGFAGALRRSELVALTVEDLERRDDGLLLHIRRSKTDQEGEGRQVAIPKGGKLRVAEQLLEWLGAAGITAGPLFRSVSKQGRVSPKALGAQAVARIVQRYATRVGLDPESFGGHSLRAGFISTALDHGADALRVMSVSGHKDVRTLRIYDRREPFRRHAGAKFL